MLSIEDINNLGKIVAQNKGLKEQNKTLQNENKQYKQIIEMITDIVTICNSGIECECCPYTAQCSTVSNALGICKMILNIIKDLQN